MAKYQKGGKEVNELFILCIALAAILLIHQYIDYRKSMVLQKAVDMILEDPEIKSYIIMEIREQIIKEIRRLCRR